MRFFYFLNILFFTQGLFCLTTPSISDSDESFSLDQYTQYLIDSTDELSVADVKRLFENNSFTDFAKNKKNVFGFNPNSIWLGVEFTIENNTHKVLNFECPYHEYIDIYLYRKESTHHFSSGNLKPFETRGKLKSTDFAWPIQFEQGEKVLMIARIKSTSSVITNVKLRSTYDYHNYSINKNIYYGFFFGILLIMILYNLFVYNILKDTSYIYYVSSVIVTLLIFSTISSYSFKYIYPNLPLLNYHIRKVLISTIVFPTALFAIHFLELRKYSRIFYSIMHIMMALAVISIILTFVGIMQSFSAILIMAHSSVLFFCGLLVYSRGNKNAFFYMIAWAFYIIGGITISLRSIGIIQADTFSNHSAELGSMFEVSLLSFALANRYRSLRKEKEHHQHEYLDLVQSQNEILEDLVGSRTFELKETLSDLESKNSLITDSINYAQKIQQAILPTKEKFLAFFPDITLLYLPKEVVSGDFYFYEKNNDNHVIAAVDCTGHGVPGAFMSMIGYNVLYDAIMVKNLTNPSHILQSLDEGISKRLLRKEADVVIKDSMDIALITINKKDNILKFSGAYRPIFIIYKNGNHEVIKGTKKSIGSKHYEFLSEFKQHEFQLDQLHSIHLFTDGFQDQFDANNDKKFTSKRLKELILKNSSLPGKTMEIILNHELETWRKKNNQTDDILVLGINFDNI